MEIVCPRCKLPQKGIVKCEFCGVVLSEYKDTAAIKKKASQLKFVVFFLSLSAIIGFSYYYCERESARKLTASEKERIRKRFEQKNIEPERKEQKSIEQGRIEPERNEQSKAKRKQKKAAIKTKSPEEIRAKKIRTQFSAWDGSHRNLERLIKKAMNDPDSYDHAETVYWDKGDHLIVKTTFRGKNAFGALVKNWVHAKVDLDGNVIQIIEQGR